MNILRIVPKSKDEDNRRRDATLINLLDRRLYQKTADAIVNSESEADRRLMLDLFATWLADEVWQAK